MSPKRVPCDEVVFGCYVGDMEVNKRSEPCLLTTSTKKDTLESVILGPTVRRIRRII